MNTDSDPMICSRAQVKLIRCPLRMHSSSEKDLHSFRLWAKERRRRIGGQSAGLEVDRKRLEGREHSDQQARRAEKIVSIIRVDLHRLNNNKAVPVHSIDLAFEFSTWTSVNVASPHLDLVDYTALDRLSLGRRTPCLIR